MRISHFNTIINSNTIVKIDNACIIKIDNCIIISDSIVIHFFSPYFICIATCCTSASEDLCKNDSSNISPKDDRVGELERERGQYRSIYIIYIYDYIGERERRPRTHAYVRTIINFFNNTNLFSLLLIVIISIIFLKEIIYKIPNFVWNII